MYSACSGVSRSCVPISQTLMCVAFHNILNRRIDDLRTWCLPVRYITGASMAEGRRTVVLPYLECLIFLTLRAGF